MEKPDVVGIDTDSQGYYWCSTFALDDGMHAEPLFTRMGSLRYVGVDAERRRVTIFHMALRLFESMPDGVHVFCEEPLALKNGKTTRVLALAAGAVWSAFVASGRDGWWHWVDVASWKKEVVGRGNASKDDVAEFCRGNPGWRDFARQIPEGGHKPFDLFPDFFDAWCIKTYGVRYLADAQPQ